MHVRMYVCMLVCMYVCIFMYTQNTITHCQRCAQKRSGDRGGGDGREGGRGEGEEREGVGVGRISQKSALYHFHVANLAVRSCFKNFLQENRLQ